MRDLLYVSETKMRALVPQLPGQVRKRLGLEAGLNAGLVSVRATLHPDEQSSLIAALDQVIEMIEVERLPRWRTDPRLRAGDWIQFAEGFRFGPAPMAHGVLPAHDLVYFVASDSEVPFVLCGSRVHLLDRHQAPETGAADTWTGFYTTALLDYAQRLAALPDEAAVADPPRLAGIRNARGVPVADDDEVTRDLGRAIRQLYRRDMRWAGHAALSGQARVLAVGGFVLATPLYVEYSADRDR
jgi:Family of unknown function (DUF7019)